MVYAQLPDDAVAAGEEAEVDPEAETQLMGDSAVMDSQVDPEAETQAMETADTDSQGCLCWNRF